MKEYITVWSKLYRYPLFNLTPQKNIPYQGWDAFLAQASDEEIQVCYDRMVAWENRLAHDLIQRGSIYQNIEVRAQLQEEEDAKRQTA